MKMTNTTVSALLGTITIHELPNELSSNNILVGLYGYINVLSTLFRSEEDTIILTDHVR